MDLEHRVLARLGAEVELAVALRLPAGIDPVDVGAPHPEHGDGPDHLDPPGVDHAPDLDHLVGAAADEDVEPGLTGLGEGGLRIEPVAEGAGAVAAQVDAGQGHATPADQLGRRRHPVEQELVVEDPGDAAAERARAGGGAKKVAHIVELHRVAHEHVAVGRLR